MATSEDKLNAYRVSGSALKKMVAVAESAIDSHAKCVVLAEEQKALEKAAIYRIYHSFSKWKQRWEGNALEFYNRQYNIWGDLKPNPEDLGISEEAHARARAIIDWGGDWRVSASTLRMKIRTAKEQSFDPYFTMFINEQEAKFISKFHDGEFLRILKEGVENDRINLG